MKMSMTILSFLICAMPFVATAQIDLVSTAEVETVLTAADGSVTTERIPAGKVIPGEEVIYTVHYENAGAEPAADVIITNPIPKHMHLLRTDGLQPNVHLVFSVDGGRSFDALARLEITGNDGRPRPATAADCTHLRWVFERQLEPGEAGAVSYVAQLL